MSEKHRDLKQMAQQVGNLLCVSPETGERLGIWNVGKEGQIGLGTKDGGEFWILESIMHESSEIEVKGLKTRTAWQDLPSKLDYMEKAHAQACDLLNAALHLLAESGVDVGSKELLAASHLAKKRVLTEVRPSLIKAYTQGYKAGHNDTVEAQYVDVHTSDEESYFSQVIDEAIQDGSYPLIQKLQEMEGA